MEIGHVSRVTPHTGSIQGADHHPPREPRKQTDHAGLRLLRRVSQKVRQRERLEVFHRPFRLPSPHCPRGHTGKSPALKKKKKQVKSLF